MEGIEKPHVGKYTEITNDWIYDASCMLTSVLVWDLENFSCLVFVVQSVHVTFIPSKFKHMKTDPAYIKFMFNVCTFQENLPTSLLLVK
jgi:hypothetical protein